MYFEGMDLPPWLLLTCQSIVGLALLLAGWRLYLGPSIMDRIVALDLIGSLIMAQFVLLVFSSRFISYLDVAAAIALISFLGTVAFSRYLEDKEAPE